MRLSLFVGVIGAVLLTHACNHTQPENTRFVKLPAEQTGIDFVNTLEHTSDLNIFNYLYFFNGGGVAVGDLNGDGLPDIYFTANQQDNQLYLNRGDLKFENITAAAGVAGQAGWTAGATMADVNGDGLLDIYVSQLGEHLTYRGKNQLYINLGPNEAGIPVFEDQAERYGLDLVGYATQAVFFDYDLDGDLDMYQLNHSVHQNGTFGDKKAYQGKRHPTAGDRLMRNDGNFFTDVTEPSGIYSNALGYGLGIAVGDINLDGWPDIYVGNDFHEDDYLYLNQGDGTFRDVMRESMRYTGRFAMGNDLADLNEDGYPELVSLDMQPYDPVILKAAAAEDPLDVFNMKLFTGYYPQYARNTLQVNQGPLPNGQDGVRFSEVGLLADVGATDWSWSALFFDMDNDSRQDLFISNGILGRSNDLDYINFMSDQDVQMRLQHEAITERELALTELMPKIKLPNFAYRHLGDFRFENMAAAWGFTDPTYSNGTAYADLDNDGDLDLVINNVNDPALVYRNQTNELAAADTPANYLAVSLEGEDANRWGVGARLIATHQERLFTQELFPTRGYQSSVDPRFHLGLGEIDRLETVTVVWPDGRYETRRDVAANQRLVFKWRDAAGKYDLRQLQRPPVTPPVFAPYPAVGLNFVHRENTFFDFNRETLIPHMLSTEGPALAVADLDGDGLDEVFLGGAKWQAGAIYRQLANGQFVATNQPDLRRDSLNEDVSAAFFDANGDGYLDLVVASGGNEFTSPSPATQPRLYRNDGQGNFRRDTAALAGLFLNASCVLPADFDGDGDTDLFLGARSEPWKYGLAPQSYLLANDGQGVFSDVTDALAPALRQAGMLKGGAWADLDGDGKPDLVLAAEWSALQIYFNRGGKLEPANRTGLEPFEGWWNGVWPADLDGDGDLDFVAGNLGLNSKLQASPEQPVRMYFGDFDQDHTPEQLLTYYLGGEERLFATRDEITKQMVSVKKKYLKYNDFAQASLTDIASRRQLDAAIRYQATEFRSGWVENLGEGRFAWHPLPRAAQWSTVNAALPHDLDGDGQVDLALFGNFYDNNIQMGRYDASYGLMLRHTGGGNYQPLTMAASGLLAPGQTRRLAWIRLPNQQVGVLLARNHDGPLIFRWQGAK